MRDVTPQRTAEEALEKSEAKYAILFNQATIPILLTTFPGLEILEVNEAWTKMLGYSREEVLGKRSDDLGITQHNLKIRDLMETIEKKRVRQ